MKILALDLGDQWTGTALSDALGITAKPYQTIATADLPLFIKKIIEEQRIKTVIIGYPITLRGTESQQTQKVLAQKKSLEQQFTALSFILWDERFTSKQAEQLKKVKTKEQKLQTHSIAAAFVLQSYLDHLYLQKISKEA